MRKQTLVSSLTNRFCFVELTLGWMPIFTRRSSASTFQIISARLSKDDTRITFASDTSFTRHTSTSWHQELGRCGGFVVCFFFFFARSLLSCGKLHRSPFEHWPFSFHWWHIPFTPSTPLNPLRFLTTAPDSIFPCLASKFRNRSFWSFSPLDHCLVFLIIVHRYLLMNLHVVPFQ